MKLIILWLVCYFVSFPSLGSRLEPVKYPITYSKCGDKYENSIQQTEEILEKIGDEIPPPQNENHQNCEELLSVTQLEEKYYEMNHYISPLLSPVERSNQCTDLKDVLESLSLDLSDAYAAINSASSCKRIALHNSSSPSGHYNLTVGNGSTLEVYCDMKGDNCGMEGGWMKVTYINKTETGSLCPQGLNMRNISGENYCGKFTNIGGCTSTTFPLHHIPYSQVCGQVRGLQYGSPEAFANYWATGYQSVEDLYCDGVSITSGHPRKHIWTYTSQTSSDDYTPHQSYRCPCDNLYPHTSAPPIVGNDYYCESGNNQTTWSKTLYLSDPLWDGKQCDHFENPCCNNSSTMPWFIKTLNYTTSDDIEIQAYNNEATPLFLIELYVR